MAGRTGRCPSRIPTRRASSTKWHSGTRRMESWWATRWTARWWLGVDRAVGGAQPDGLLEFAQAVLKIGGAGHGEAQAIMRVGVVGHLLDAQTLPGDFVLNGLSVAGELLEVASGGGPGVEAEGFVQRGGGCVEVSHLLGKGGRQHDLRGGVFRIEAGGDVDLFSGLFGPAHFDQQRAERLMQEGVIGIETNGFG